MNVLKRLLQNRIRGWFPSTPTMPQQKNNIGTLNRTKTSTNPLPPSMENKFQRWVGILIGLGTGLALLGFGAALTTNIAYNQTVKILSDLGMSTESYLLRDLLQQTALFLALAVGGIFLTVLSAISLKTNIFRIATIDKEKHFLGNFLFGFGAFLLIYSFRYIFLFLMAPNDSILNHDFFQLKMFTGVFIVGACLFTSGMLSWRRKK